MDGDPVGELIATLVDARKQLGLSQRAIGLRLHVSQSMVSRMEDGRVDAPLRLLVHYAAVVGVDVSWELHER